ncbi:MAG TPA: ABC transporter permease [Nocardioides sp.]|uniref:ABC transporter permease n=1 Tax=Nocardioides sp. TaxID=35761 RepID=UPI002C68A12F|nr:ABC transporter permease [Nocardioides sp.]HQR26602.1 ABC transporter permease [Nocardioides sp.]
MSSVMSVTAARREEAAQKRTRMYYLIGLVALVSVALVRVLTGAHEIDSQGSLRAAIVATCPILLAALGGLWSERSGVVNIGLEGQILLGTWGAAFFTYYYGPYIGLLGAVLFGMAGGLIHALATVTFGVDHIVSGVALNVIALGLTTFLAEAFFADLDSKFGHGGAQQLTGLQKPFTITIPGVSDFTSDLAAKHWFLVSDVAAFIAAVTTSVSIVTVVVFVLVAVTGWVLWRTRFGLRLRSCGENPYAAESLGVNVRFYKYVAVLISGGLAGLGGGYLALVSSPGFHTNQANGRGYIGLAAMIFGNWRPGGVLLGSGMFGYTDSLRLRDPATIHAMLLLVGAWLIAFAAYKLWRRQTRSGIVLGVFGLFFLVWFLTTDEVPVDLTSMTPYLVTLLVLAFASQRLRMPAADGQVYRKGSVG